MTSIYDFTDYRRFLAQTIQDRGPGKKGLQQKIAAACQVSPTLISLILKGEKHLSLEQASDLADFFGLGPKETEYLFLMVEYGRAGTVRLQKKLKKQMSEFVAKISRRVRPDMELPEQVKGVFYSNWIYSAVRNLAAVPEFADAKSISHRLGVPLPIVESALEFLLENKLCLREDGRITYGPKNTHVDSDSPFVLQHHRNWRTRGYQEMEKRLDSNLFYTCPMSASRDVAKEIRHMLPKVIEDVLKRVGPSPSESLYCFNLDWFEF